MFRVKIQGPSVTNRFDLDIFVIDRPSDVQDRNGVLVVTLPATPERPHPNREGAVIAARRSTQVVYPRGGWTKVIVEDVVDDV